MVNELGFSTAALYGMSTVLYFLHMHANKKQIGRAATLSLAAALLLNYLSLLERSRYVQSVPYQDLYGSMSLFAWMLGLTYLGLELFHRQRAVGPFVMPFVFVLSILAGVGTVVPPSSPPARGPLFALHVTLNILAYASFAIAFVLSLIYLIQDRVLRGRRPGLAFWRFPALEVLDRMSRSSVSVGVLSLGVGMTFGFVWVHRVQGHFWTADPKEITSLAILGLYLGYWWLARDTAWRGARASLLCVINFLVVLFSFTVVNLYLSSYHRYF